MTKHRPFRSSHLNSLFDKLDNSADELADIIDGDAAQEDSGDDDTDKPTSPQALVIGGPENSTTRRLISQQPHYVLGLRICMLRVLLHTAAANRLSGKGGYHMNLVTSFLGLTNFERYALGRTLEEIHADLLPMLHALESERNDNQWLPSTLDTNLKALSLAVGLNATETAVLGFVVVLNAEQLLEHCTDLIGHISGVSVHNPIAQILGLPAPDVQAALSPSSRLTSSGLVTIDLQGQYDMKSLIDLLTHNFHARMVMPLADVRELVSDYVRPAKPTVLTLENYAHIAKLVTMTTDYLKGALQHRKPGSNILIHGAPGTGKSQFARLVAQHLGAALMEVSPTTPIGVAIVPIRRIRNFTIAQSFYAACDCILLFDEVEEILSPVGSETSTKEATIPRKSFLNDLLETSLVPTIWIANDISQFDAAYMRRFDICFEMPMPPSQTRLQMLNTAFKGLCGISGSLLAAIANHDGIGPALIEQAAKVTELVMKSRISRPAANESSLDELVVGLLNEKLRAQNTKPLNHTVASGLKTLKFTPELVNCTADLNAIATAINATGTGRLYLYGPPGTGKTAFGKWLAQRVGRPHMALGASDLMSMYVGETEQNIARAFATAKREGAVLQFDEVDTFLQDRHNAQRHYETTQVNEMLTQIENFDGIIIASTNLMDSIDEAALRRFDMVLKFDFLTRDAALALFEQACNLLGFDSGSSDATRKLQGLRGLAAGDFDQALRRARLTPPNDVNALAAMIVDAVHLKNRDLKMNIGFLRAA